MMPGAFSRMLCRFRRRASTVRPEGFSISRTLDAKQDIPLSASCKKKKQKATKYRNTNRFFFLETNFWGGGKANQCFQNLGEWA